CDVSLSLLLHQYRIKLAGFRAAGLLKRLVPKLQESEFGREQIFEFFSAETMRPIATGLFFAEHFKEIMSPCMQDASDFADGLTSVRLLQHMEAASVIDEIDKSVFHRDPPDVPLLEEPEEPVLAGILPGQLDRAGTDIDRD